MDISAISNPLLQQIANGATRNGDAVTISVMRKAMDIQASQSMQLIESASQAMPAGDGRLGGNIDVMA